MCPRSMLSKNKKKYHKFSSENYHFTAVKNHCILHRNVIVKGYCNIESFSDTVDPRTDNYKCKWSQNSKRKTVQNMMQNLYHCLISKNVSVDIYGPRLESPWVKFATEI